MLVMLAVILIPMILDDTTDRDIVITETNIPARPKDDFNSRIVPLKESDLTPIPMEAAPPVETEQMVEVLTEASKPIEQESSGPEEPSQSVQPVHNRETAVVNNHMGVTAWVVQLGSFSSEENAKGLNEKLRAAGFPAFVEPLKRSSGIVYRVRVGPEILRSDAEALEKKIKKSMDIDGLIIRYP